MRAALDEFFQQNQIIVLFLYGQVFFVLGLAIALQSWRHSRLVLARSLGWLAAFGFVHGLHEWGHVFIPIQAQYLREPLVELLIIGQTVLLGVSFACLFQFGVELLRPLPARWRLLRLLPCALLLLWGWGAFGLVMLRTTQIPAWHQSMAALARYGLGLPGALLTAYSLRNHAQRLIAPLSVASVIRQLRLAGLALVGYGLFAGLIVEAALFFPANWLNDALLRQIAGVPTYIFRSLSGLVLTIAIIRALDVFAIELDRRLGQMEETQVILAERERIGRELHDGTLQKIYAAGLLLQSTQHATNASNHSTTAESIQQSVDLLDDAVADIRGYIGELRPVPTAKSVAIGLRELGQQQHLRSLVDVDLTVDLPEGEALSTSQVGHLLAIGHEALSNVIRHAKATKVRIAAAANEKNVSLTIEDNGVGLPADYVLGYGLQNMRERAHLLGGEINITSDPGHKTTVHVSIPRRSVDEHFATIDRR